VIVGAFGGAVFCDIYCEFDVPEDIYGDFVAAVDEAQTPDAEAAESAADDAAYANLPPDEQATRRVEKEHGWNKAVAMLEEAAAEDDKEAAEAKKNGDDDAETVIDQPEEQVDVVIDEGDKK